MKVIAAINGTIISEGMAFYALKYAQVQNLTLVLLHIENKKDKLSDVESSIERIKTLGLSQNVQIESVILQGKIKKALNSFMHDTYVDVIFCAARRQKSYISDSFGEILTNMNLNTDIAIARILKINTVMDLSNITLCIRKDKLSVKKFTFFTTLALAYKASGDIYSVSGMSKIELSMIKMHQIRDRLALINYNLRHYLKLANLLKFPLRIKHDFTNDETNDILTYVAESNTHLLVMGGKKSSIESFFQREIPIERLLNEISVNTIVYYPKEN
ncbi:MAG: hypothetical protein A2513_04870 [Sulfurimonas sp. RIFOXYD12_FULL_33_39]|uniref:hypothetical protein n=1 Tax=unclassified Sulfurimonas TaxID=2623549 RepID=UPI0008BBB019|nr:MULTISPECIES: hypothetical protein [unclassified Sulfurimonas]OHE03242.1 MAG: hypothetical protein A3G74_03580 [Sulfurimonas sp. RIFCSPLOWO2_12_FULL_34_6]OHE09459.1 MAG: hypothetical protein A2513_04870 [Sulfurimonas sp. RIFOXYD12_FULL_33_39]OHE12760.1 MAG: hypothetical protein A2530_03935 [Sulfurimonas sp. RIFOXYD2_FULL_34_21]